MDSAFARFNTIITGLKALDEGYSSKNYVRKFLRALHLKWRTKVTAIEESKDLTSLSLNELIGNLKVYEMIIKKDSDIVKAKVERKSIALKAKKESSDEEYSTSESEDEEYAMVVRDFKNFFIRRECPKPSRDKNQRAFVRGSWSDIGEEDDKKVIDETCLVAHASSYTQNSKAYIVLNKHTKKVKESLNLTFDETLPPSKTSPLVDGDLDEEEAIKVIEKKNLENDIVDETLEIDKIVNIKESRNHPLENVIRNFNLRNLNQRTLRSQAQNKINFFCFISTIETKKVNEALGDEIWIVAMQEELNQFVANGVWELVPQPKNRKIIGTKWVFRNKLDENGIVSRNKARLVAQGYNQQQGIDYDETYAPVARLESIRILLSYACGLDFKLFQMDVKSAFLKGFINEEVYVAQPLRFIDFKKPNHVYKFNKALYDLKQAPEAWYDRLKAFLIKHEYKMRMVKNTLFTKKKSSNLIIVQIYVDDIIFGLTCQDMCDEFAQIMHDGFEMSMMGELNFFLRLQIKQMEDGIFFNESKYIKEMLKKFGLEDSKPMKTSISYDTKLTKDEECELVDSTKYRGMTSSLLYLTTSRLDIMFSVCLCAHFQESPKTFHLEAVKHIFRYIKATTRLGLCAREEHSYSSRNEVLISDLSSFLIDPYEVTVARWRSRVAARSSPPPSPIHDSPPTLHQILPAPSRLPCRLDVLVLSGQPILVGRPYGNQPNGVVKMLTSRKSVGPLPTHRLALRYLADYSSSDHSTSNYTTRDSLSDSLSRTSSDYHSDTSSDSSSRHSSSASTIPEALSLIRGDLLPLGKRISDFDSVTEFEADNACIMFVDDIPARGRDVRVEVRTADKEEADSSARDTIEVGVDRVTHPVVLDDTVEPVREDYPDLVSAYGSLENYADCYTFWNDPNAINELIAKRVVEALEAYDDARNPETKTEIEDE
uniref:Retrovirus-related Pol polyprotein from transposon TNT 1-94 n=1 Tax=Tanacetum cinerariifolium TaxID=118510 RepID=A0A6L2MNE8_TANCI|nr:retrovirus-related Pol polyprotein from transposon TNT 1-94 [Tanacetum cinerariifolium]